MKIDTFLRRLCLLCLPVSIVIAARAQAGTLYVSIQGNDSNPGTSSQPFRTITRAYSSAGPGTTILVAPGTYTDYSSGWGLHLGTSGSASSPIVLRSQVRGQAIIDGQNASDRNEAIYIDGNYNVVDGFKITGGPNGGITIWSSGNQVANCEIYNNGNPASTSINGRDGIYDDQSTSGNVYANNYIHNNGRSGSNLDHGIYLCGSNETVCNNVLANNAASGLQVAGYSTVSNLKVYNNVMALNGTSGIILWMSLNGIDIRNNIIFQNGHYGIGSYAATGVGVNVDHNVVYGNGYGGIDFLGGASTYSYTLGTVLNADPGLANETASGFDAHLATGSPAIQAGVNLSSYFTTDLAGAARPATGAWDLGAYVYGSGTPADTTPPTVAITAPANASTVSGTITVSASATDNVSVASVRFLLDGASPGVTLTTPPYQVTWSTLSSINGAHTLTAIAVDAAGNKASTAISATVDNPPPVVALTSPATGSAFTAPATLNLAANVTANGHAISQVLFYNGSTLLGTATTAPYSFTWSQVPAGAYALSAVAVYEASQMTSSARVSVSVVAPQPTKVTFAATSGVITAPFTTTAAGTIVQPAYTSVTAGGQAVYSFTLAAAGNYVISAMVIAPSTDNNSFFVNIDAQPTSPTMIWDVNPVSTLTSETATWRGNGVLSASSPSGFTAQFSPAVFSLSAGTHQLIVRGREGNTQLGQITIAPQ